VIFQPDLLKGQVALITGGGTGLGFAMATAMARCGADVAIASRRAKHLEPAAETLGEHGTRVLAVQANVREPDSVRAAVEQVARELGRIDILVNNAAGNFYAPSAELSPKGWQAVVETDLYGSAKAGIDALTKTLALEWAKDQITVNVIAPGPIPTEGASKAFAVGGVAIEEGLSRFIPLGTLGTPEDVANMAVYLAGPGGSWITGAIFVVDGGSSLAKAF
jgi:NAD(P)-dependent dehydrogenase (short-subunit alcohol dehydrogenase family)